MRCPARACGWVRRSRCPWAELRSDVPATSSTRVDGMRRSRGVSSRVVAGTGSLPGSVPRLAAIEVLGLPTRFPHECLRVHADGCLDRGKPSRAGPHRLCRQDAPSASDNSTPRSSDSVDEVGDRVAIQAVQRGQPPECVAVSGSPAEVERRNPVPDEGLGGRGDVLRARAGIGGEAAEEVAVGEDAVDEVAGEVGGVGGLGVGGLRCTRTRARLSSSAIVARAGTVRP